MNTKIGIIGVGNLGSSIANGLLKSGVKADDLILSEYKLELLNNFKNSGCKLTTDNKVVTSESDIIIIAVKPFKLLEVVTEIKSSLNDSKTIVSVVTGVTIDEILNATSANQKVARVMPNTAISTQESISCIASKKFRWCSKKRNSIYIQ